ncbi:uncharacterized protein LOC101893332 [Musca domestica]|uniref:Uncharacterized protein LOC101893332 n=1 Tax=Musca domestica TaxID=7370 RepID=A0A9J7DEV2_MUSDO|nr:uncharacterized protein LOC101893332 [Musca domestica]XP_019890617.2 uncharacterized protein LOC101893332 [Musca domestica]XP_058980434.1 uncharacterized protein LOC101893332 [Musca domestica]
MNNSLQTSSSSYGRSVFEHPSEWYDSYQENGTKYLKSRKKLDEQLQNELNACVGEIFLDGIPADTRPEKIAEIASQLGEVYVLRFKVNFSGDSRGFAYLQYTNPSLMSFAISKLPTLFQQNSLPMIRVRQSRNSSVLLLRRVHHMTANDVFDALARVINFHLLISHEISAGNYEYFIIFKCNEEAVHARRELLRTITQFGRSAVIVWDNGKSKHRNGSLTYIYNRQKLAAPTINGRHIQIYSSRGSDNTAPPGRVLPYQGNEPQFMPFMNLPLQCGANQYSAPTNVLN